MTQTITTKIAGIFRYPEAKLPTKAMAVGDPYFAVPEPENIHDPKAIAIYTARTQFAGQPLVVPAADIKCGYIPKVTVAEIGVRKIISVKKGLTFDAITIEVE